MDSNRIENTMDITGRVSFDPRTIGSKGTKCYDVSFYVGKGSKGSSMEGKSEYMYATVYDWDDVCADKDIKKGDFIRVIGAISVNRYRTKSGEEKVSTCINARKMKKVDGPSFGGNRSSKKIDDDVPDLF